MSASLRGIAVGFLISTLAGCASGGAYMDTATKAKVTASEGVVGVTQPELNVMIQPVTVAPAGGFIGGFIGGLASGAIENSALKKAEKKIGPLRNSLINFDFDGQLLSTMQAQLPKADWLHLGKVALTKDASGDAYDKTLLSAQTPYILFVTVNYYLSFDFKQLSVIASVKLLPKATLASTVQQGPNGTTYHLSPSADKNAIYTKTVSYQAGVPQGIFDKNKAQIEATPDGAALNHVDLAGAAAIQYWAQDDAAMMKAALADAIRDLSRLAADGLQNPGKPTAGPDLVAVGPQEGHIIENEPDGRVVIQFDDGSVMSVDAQLVKYLRTGKQY